MEGKDRNGFEAKRRKGFLENEIVILLLGPFIFLFVVKFTGYQIFYNQGDDSKERRKAILLLSSGAIFYLTIIIVMLLTVE